VVVVGAVNSSYVTRPLATGCRRHAASRSSPAAADLVRAQLVAPPDSSRRRPPDARRRVPDAPPVRVQSAGPRPLPDRRPSRSSRRPGAAGCTRPSRPSRRCRCPCRRSARLPGQPPLAVIPPDDGSPLPRKPRAAPPEASAAGPCSREPAAAALRSDRAVRSASVEGLSVGYRRKCGGGNSKGQSLRSRCCCLAHRVLLSPPRAIETPFRITAEVFRRDPADLAARSRPRRARSGGTRPAAAGLRRRRSAPSHTGALALAVEPAGISARTRMRSSDSPSLPDQERVLRCEQRGAGPAGDSDSVVHVRPRGAAPSWRRCRAPRRRPCSSSRGRSAAALNPLAPTTLMAILLARGVRPPLAASSTAFTAASSRRLSRPSREAPAGRFGERAADRLGSPAWRDRVGCSDQRAAARGASRDRAMISVRVQALVRRRGDLASATVLGRLGEECAPCDDGGRHALQSAAGELSPSCPAGVRHRTRPRSCSMRTTSRGDLRLAAAGDSRTRERSATPASAERSSGFHVASERTRRRRRRSGRRPRSPWSRLGGENHPTPTGVEIRQHCSAVSGERRGERGVQGASARRATLAPRGLDRLVR